MNFIEVSGEAFEMGLSQGRKLKEEIQKAYITYIFTPYFKNVKPKLLPFFIFERVAIRKAFEALRDILAFTPRMWERFEGISNGSEISMNKLALMHAGEIMLNKVEYTLGSCTGIAITPERSESGKMMILKNFDYPVEFEPFNLLRVSIPKGYLKSVDFTMVPIVGSHDAMNQAGLTILYNYGLSIEEGEKGPLITALIQEVLEECENVECALKKFENKNYPSSAIIMLADRKEAVVLEITPKHFGIRYPEEGYLVMTNHFRTEEVKPYDIPSEAVFSKKAIKDLRGVRIHQSDELRYERAEKLLKESKKISLQDAFEIIKDHNNEDPSDDTICRHSYPYSTIGSVIFVPDDKRVFYKSGRPCQGSYKEMVL